MTNKVQLIKEEIEMLKDCQSPIVICDTLLQFIDSLPEESASEDLEEEIKHYINEEVIVTSENVVISKHHEFHNFYVENLVDVAHHFAEWQKQKDESRRKANIAIANTDIPKCTELEIAFEDIWSDVENCVSDLNKLSNEQKCKLKNAHHDTFEAGAEWQKQQMMKDAVEAEVVIDRIGEVVYLCPHLSEKLSDKVKIIIVKEE